MVLGKRRQGPWSAGGRGEGLEEPRALGEGTRLCGHGAVALTSGGMKGEARSGRVWRKHCRPAEGYPKRGEGGCCGPMPGTRDYVPFLCPPARCC